MVSLSPNNCHDQQTQSIWAALCKYGMLLLTILILGFSYSSRAYSQQEGALSAFVDRTEVSVNDILTLTIRVGAVLGDEPPSLSGLNDDFDRLGTTISSSYTSVNGKVEEWTEYRVTLKPKNTGTYIIPAFRKGSQLTQSITINVGDAAQLNGASNEEIFLISTVSKSSVYVQEQLIHTTRLYYSLRFDQGAQLSQPQVENAVIQQLGTDQVYQEIVEGIRYDVTERKFVIFPQSSGELVIPPVYFTASIGGRSGVSRLLSRNTPARQINLASDAHIIEVKGIPPSFNGGTWLPASELTIEEAWSDGASELEVGESVTRNLTLRAEGLSSSLLPTMEYEAVEGLRFYPDQPTRQDAANSNGVVGIRSEGTAIVAADNGEYTLAKIEVSWWNTELDRMEIASVPSRTLNVSGSIPDGVQPAPVIPSSDKINENMTLQAQTNPLNTLWISTTVLFGLAWLLSTFFWLRTRQAMADVRLMGGAQTSMFDKSSKNGLDNLPTPENSLRYLQKACDDNDLSNIRRWSISWGQAFFENSSLKTLDQLQASCQSERISKELYTMERALYGNTVDKKEFSAQELIKEIIAINRKGNKSVDKKNNDDTVLPPLYKN